MDQLGADQASKLRAKPKPSKTQDVEDKPRPVGCLKLSCNCLTAVANSRPPGREGTDTKAGIGVSLSGCRPLGYNAKVASESFLQLRCVV